MAAHHLDQSTGARARRRAKRQEGERTVTVTHSPEHGLGFVVPTLVYGGRYEMFTCRDCARPASYGHAPDCPQAAAPVERDVQMPQGLTIALAIFVLCAFAAVAVMTKAGGLW